MAKAKKMPSVKYSLSATGSFKIKNYNQSKTFSNFFPGIAGLWGIPMWVFYVNRGQCISSFGIEDKDKAIVEFQPANKAYRQTSLQGFRTFVKVRRGKTSVYWEPFQKNLLGTQFKKRQVLSVNAHDLTIEETNEDLGLKITINYFTIPEEPFSALVREVNIKNLRKGGCSLEVLDGLPLINAYGLRDALNKNIARTAEAWIRVRNLHNKAPYYQLNVEIADKPEVTHIRAGNFFFSFDSSRGKAGLAEPIVEAPYIFGESSDYSAPELFFDKGFALPDKQKTDNKTPAAMGHHAFTIKGNQQAQFTSLYGFAHDISEVDKIVGKVTKKGYIREKQKRNKEIIDEIRDLTFTKSSSNAFDLYSSHTFLDNVLRGGLPVSLKTKEGNVAFNVYSRKHGDLERDYNYFNLSPSFYSQGNGNYRDVNQNRRNDVWFNADVGDSHIMTFLNLIQADGYNPLIVKGTSFSVADEEQLKAIVEECTYDPSEKFFSFFHRPFKPGDLLTYITHHEVQLKIDKKEFLGKVLKACQKHQSAEHGEGFWSDHWHYNLDLIESHRALYPDQFKKLLVDNKKFTFYHNGHFILPREQRYILTGRGVRQYASVAEPTTDTKEGIDGFSLRTKAGEGGIYKTNLLVKLLCLISNKIATLDPGGVGVEMEADKPNWYDALNGLPGLLGSSISETIEIKRFAQFLLNAFDEINIADSEEIGVFEELATFLSGLSNLLTIEEDDLSYWQKANDIKEHYRQRIRKGIDGKEQSVSISEIKDFLISVVKRVDAAMEKATNEEGFLHTYFYYEVTDYDALDNTQSEQINYVRPKAFKRHDLPMFLEGYVHALRAAASHRERQGFYEKIRKSGLFDKKMKMYKVNSDLSSQSEEIGRTRIFPSGWLENESVWLHMEYKFMLELLREGMAELFYENIKNVLIPFQPPQRYGRSILENSSFIVSSAHEDPQLHGRGFVARLSGSTAEFLHIWLYMNLGPRPFKLNSKGGLTLHFEPALAGWLFTKKKTKVSVGGIDQRLRNVELPANVYAFKLLGHTLVVYHNPKRKNTFGRKAAKIKQIRINIPGEKKPIEAPSPTIPLPYSQNIRDQLVERIDVFFE